MVLTKTTAAFLLPAVAWMLWARAGYRLRPFLRLGAPAGVLAAILWGGYYGLVVRPHFLADYQYLFSANAYTGMTRENALSCWCKPCVTGCGWASSSIRWELSRR